MEYNQQIKNIIPSEEKWNIIPISLRDIYGIIFPEKVINVNGPEEISDIAEDLAAKTVNMEYGGDELYLRGNNIFAYIAKQTLYVKNHIITFIIPGLRNIYWTNKHLLPKDEQTFIGISMKKPLPQFEYIYSYPQLEKYKSDYQIPEYQLFGSITPYDVLHIPVNTFVNFVNDKNPIYFMLSPLNVIIVLTYEDYDLYDNELGELVTYINPQLLY